MLTSQDLGSFQLRVSPLSNGRWELLIAHTPSSAPSVDFWSSRLPTFSSPSQSYDLKILVSLAFIIFYVQFFNFLNKWDSIWISTLVGKVHSLSSPRFYNPCYQPSNLSKQLICLFLSGFLFGLRGQFWSSWFQIF